MTYTGGSLIQGQGVSTAAEIDAWFAREGPGYAPAYAPDGQYKPPPPLGQHFIDCCRLWPPFIVNHDLVAGQCLHESAAWQSGWARNHNNPAGLGVTGVPGAGETFATPYEGIRAQVAHLLSYDVGYGPWVQFDPRYDDMSPDVIGVCNVLNDLNGRWATPGDNYGNMIAEAANELLEMEAPMSGEVPGFTWDAETCGEIGYPTGSHGRNGYVVDRLIIHCTLGTDSLAWIKGCHENSIHFLDWRDGTPRVQMVKCADAAWGAGNQQYNLRGLQYEHEATEAEMVDPSYWTDEIIDNMAANAAGMIRVNPGIKPDRAHVIGHGEVPNQTHWDPGPAFPWGRFMDAINRELGTLPQPPADSHVMYLPNNPYGAIPITWGFKAWCEAQGHARYAQDTVAGILSIVGYPQANEYPTSFGSAQAFERAVLLWYRDTAAPWDVVLALREQGESATRAIERHLRDECEPARGVDRRRRRNRWELIEGQPLALGERHDRPG